MSPRQRRRLRGIRRRGLDHVRKKLQAEPDCIWLYGCLMVLLSRASNTEARLAGYLLDAKDAPAATSTIASWLGIDAARAKKVLLRFEALGILERVTLPSGMRVPA